MRGTEPGALLATFGELLVDDPQKPIGQRLDITGLEVDVEQSDVFLLALLDGDGAQPEPDEQDIEEAARGPSVTVLKRMNLNDLRMRPHGQGKGCLREQLRSDCE